MRRTIWHVKIVFASMTGNTEEITDIVADGIA